MKYLSTISPVIRFWGGHRESDWNEYWTMDRVLRQRDELTTALRRCGVMEVDICPAQRLHAPFSPHRLEIFLRNTTSPDATQRVCDEIYKVTGRYAVPVPASTGDEFNALVAARLLYRRRYLDLWDEVLPRFILGVDFDSGRHVRLRPAEPAKWRVVDHYVDHPTGDRRVLPAMLLDPSEKGATLLAELKKEFGDWYKYDFRSRPSLTAIIAYRDALQRYGVDCNESFRYGLADGWFPIDAEEQKDWNAVRELCETALPDNAGDLLRDEENKPVGRYGAIFSFVALTDNSG